MRAACDSAAARWLLFAGAQLERGDTLRDMIDDSVLSTPDALPEYACRVTGTHPSGLADAARARLLWPGTDWPFLWRLTADGPDGSVQIWQRGWVRCQVREEWDGGDDSDSTYIPDPFYREVTLCWRHPRLIVAADTAPWRY